MGNRTRILGISSALASLVLAGATTASASTAKPIAHALSARAVTAHATSATKNVHTVGAVRASVTAKPSGYKLITSSAIPAANGVQTSSSLTCPLTSTGIQTVPLNGGAVISSSSLFANINTSMPNPDGKSWRVDVNNASGAATTFVIYVVCAKPLHLYAVLSGSGTNNANSQNQYSIACPTGSTIIGGGALSSSGSTSVNLNSDYPNSTTTWEIDINNATSVDATVTLFEICAKLKATAHYTRVVGPVNDNPPGAESNSHVFCPTGLSVLGGGISSSSASTAVNLNTTNPVKGEWNGWENNASGSDTQVTSFATCAS